jgi:glutamyl-tRNA synthetase
MEVDMVTVRFAPSPTGELHIGGARTALFNWLYARNTGGKFILRIEDTDVQRVSHDAVSKILDSLSWLGLNWDEGPYFQSERLEIYNRYARKLLEEGKAYYCRCSSYELEEQKKQATVKGRSPGYNGKCRDKRYSDGVLRFKTPEGITTFHDIVHGDVSYENNLIGDFVIVRSNGIPTYNLTCVIDDALMGVTHVIRGDDHISNTPKQILLNKELGFDNPKFVHLPLILGQDRIPLSKRHGAVSVISYKKDGFLPEALVNYLALLGWSTSDSQQIFSVQELIKKFSLKRISNTPAVFDIEKLKWLNSVYIKHAKPEYILHRLKDIDNNYHKIDNTYLEQVVKLYQGRIKTLLELYDKGDFFFVDDIDISEEVYKDVLAKDEVYDILNKVKYVLNGLSEFNIITIEDGVRTLAQQMNIKAGDIIHPLRAVLTGKKVSPGIFEVIYTLGKDKVIYRIETMLKYLKERKG